MSPRTCYLWPQMANGMDHDLPLFSGLLPEAPPPAVPTRKQIQQLELNEDQKAALEVLLGTRNVFLTGVAGSGKSTLIRHFLQKTRPAEEGGSNEFPILASTGAAAILIGGRTFHSYFGLGILQGGAEATIERAVGNTRLVRRLKKTRAIIIDEVSMLSGTILRVAETISRIARGRSEPWGGIRVIAVGDFAQLPPVTMHGEERDWGFRNGVWQKSNFVSAVLRTIMRTTNPDDGNFLDVLNQVRLGRLTPEVSTFLNSRITPEAKGVVPYEGTRLFPHRDTTERFNLEQLEKIPGETQTFETVYTGDERHVTELKRSAPIPEMLKLKDGALVMLRQNDPLGRWVNGSLARILKATPGRLRLTLLDRSGTQDRYEIDLEPQSFSILNPEGVEVASARNFPVNLAYATTIHKAQGMTLDRLVVDLRHLWEPGQAYVAMSRVRASSGLHITAWTPRSIHADAQVSEFNRQIWAGETGET